jgi:hypothetical protein
MANIFTADLVKKADALRVLFQAMQSRPEKLVPKQSLISQTRMSIVTISVVPETIQGHMNEVSPSISHAGYSSRIDLCPVARGL